MNRQEIRAAYVHHRNLLQKGYQEFAVAVGLWNSSVLLWVVLNTVFGLESTYAWVTFLSIPFVGTILYLYGMMYYKKGFLSEEQRWFSQNNEAYWQMMNAINQRGVKRVNVREELLKKIVPVEDHVGLCLSGGIDSSAVLEALVAQGVSPTCFVARFNEEGDQVEMAKEVAYHYHVPIIIVDIKDFFKDLPGILRFFQFPRYNVWPMWIMRDAASRGIKTMYVGEGSDEIFGYPDRSYLAGWAGQLVWVYPVWETCAGAFGIKLRAPFMELEDSLDYTRGHIPRVDEFVPYNKDSLRAAYKGILPDFVLNRPSIPPSGAFYRMAAREMGLDGLNLDTIKSELQRRAAEAWLQTRSKVTLK